MKRRTNGVIRRGTTWSVVLDLGDQVFRQCPACRRRYWTRDGAVEKILRIHGKYLERLDLVGRVDHHHHTGSAPEIVMPEETRAQLREALTLWRQQSPRTLPSLVTRNGGEVVNGDY